MDVRDDGLIFHRYHALMAITTRRQIKLRQMIQYDRNRSGSMNVQYVRTYKLIKLFYTKKLKITRHDRVG